MKQDARAQFTCRNLAKLPFGHAQSLAYLALELAQEAGERLLDAQAGLLILIWLKHVWLEPQQRYPAANMHPQCDTRASSALPKMKR
jgi:hypothetical protein